jgi:hypothetical protein
MMHGRPGRLGARPVVIVSSIVLVAVVFVALTLRRPPPQGYAPTPDRENEAGAALVGPIEYTVNATAPDVWVFFSFSRGRTVPRNDPRGWDLAFQRFHIIANGGTGFPGKGGVRDLGEIAFDSVMEVPADGYVGTQPKSDSTNSAIARWYRYGWSSHLLQPRPNVYAIRTADRRYAKLQIIGYYCVGAVPGCLTFRYVFQGNGTNRFSSGADSVRT